MSDVSNELVRALIIEDNPGDVRLIQEMLAEVAGAEFDLACAERLSTALRCLAEGDIDVILTDLSLPDSQGLETFVKVYSQAWQLPIVVLTSLDDEAAGVKAVREGAQDYLVKGHIDGNLLVRAMRYAIERKRVEEDLRLRTQELETALEQLQATQEQLVQSDRLASLGQMAAGIAHEINNPLTSVIGYSQLLLGQGMNEAAKRDLEQVFNEAQRAARIVCNLLAFARGHKPEKQYIDVNSAIEKTVELRAYDLRVNNVEVTMALDPHLPQAWADSQQLQQVFLNIVINAEQAMLEAHGRGLLTIKTKRVNDNIKIAFADDGPGISKQNLKRVFDPFFTTKEVGKGTGLGLSICYGLIKENGGSIYGQSQLGKGTTIVIELPVAQPL
ncbi:MAG: sensor histidine kinase [Dehalococcoidia bacterium]